MIEEILSAAAVVEEAWEDAPGVALFPDEEAVLGNAVEKRRREFTTARRCARRQRQRTLRRQSPRSTMAITGPPPCGPWCIASTETNTAGSPIAAAATPPTAALECR